MIPTVLGYLRGKLVYVECCYCGRKHAHGWPDSPDATTHRGSHCRTGSRPYRIVLRSEPSRVVPPPQGAA